MIIASTYGRDRYRFVTLNPDNFQIEDRGLVHLEEDDQVPIEKLYIELLERSSPKDGLAKDLNTQ